MNLGKEIFNIKIDDIIPNRFQPRLTFNEEELNELTASIKQHGIIQPLVLRKVGDKYEIIAGERRFKSALKAGLTEVPAIVTDLDDKESAEIAVVENIQRKQLSAIEEAKSYKKLLDLGQLTQEQLAIRMGKSQSNVANKLRLLNLNEEVQQALLSNKISERHARSLLQIKDLEEQKNILNMIINDRLTVKQTDDLIKDMLNNNTNNINNNFVVNENNNVNNNDNNIFSNINTVDNLNENLSVNNNLPINNDIINLNADNNNIMNMDINNNMQSALNGLDIVDTKSDVFNDTQSVVEDKTQTIDVNKIKEVASDLNKPKDLPNFDDLLKSDLPDNNEDKVNNNNLFSLNGNKFFPSLNDDIPTTNDLSSNINAKNVDFNEVIKPIDIAKIDNNNDVLEIKPIIDNNNNNNDNVNNIVNSIKDSIKNFDNSKGNIVFNELDLPDRYQITIDIMK